MKEIKFEADVVNGMIKIPERFKNIESKHLEIIALVVSKNEIKKTGKSDTYRKLEELNEKLGGDELIELKLKSYSKNYTYNNTEYDDELLVKALEGKYDK